MSHRRFESLLVVVMNAAIVVACSGRSPATPSSVTGGSTDYSVQPNGSGVPGSYVLSFYGLVDGAYQSVTILPVNHELILKAHVADSSGLAAVKGSVAFQACSTGSKAYSQLDPVPYLECQNGGSARWVTLMIQQIDADTCRAQNRGLPEAGSVCMDFGFVRNPRVAGFRFKYNAQGSDIASAVSGPADFTWTSSSLF